MVMPRLGPMEIGTILRNTGGLIPLGPNEGVIKEAEVTKHKCSYCGDTLDTSAALKSHVELEHPGEAIPEEVPTYVCPYCSAEFDTFATLKSHDDAEHPIVIRPLHWDEMPFFVMRFKRIKRISLEEEERIVETVGRAYDELKAFVKKVS